MSSTPSSSSASARLSSAAVASSTRTQPKRRSWVMPMFVVLAACLIALHAYRTTNRSAFDTSSNAVPPVRQPTLNEAEVSLFEFLQHNVTMSLHEAYRLIHPPPQDQDAVMSPRPQERRHAIAMAFAAANIRTQMAQEMLTVVSEMRMQPDSDGAETPPAELTHSVSRNVLKDAAHFIASSLIRDDALNVTVSPPLEGPDMFAVWATHAQGVAKVLPELYMNEELAWAEKTGPQRFGLEKRDEDSSTAHLSRALVHAVSFFSNASRMWETVWSPSKANAGATANNFTDRCASAAAMLFATRTSAAERRLWKEWCRAWFGTPSKVEQRLAALYEELIVLHRNHAPIRLHYLAAYILLADDVVIDTSKQELWATRELDRPEDLLTHTDSARNYLLLLCRYAIKSRSGDTRVHGADITTLKRILHRFPTCESLRYPFTESEVQAWTTFFGTPSRPAWVSESQVKRIATRTAAFVRPLDPNLAEMILTAWGTCN